MFITVLNGEYYITQFTIKWLQFAVLVSAD